MKRQPELITLIMVVDRSVLDMFLFVYCKQNFFKLSDFCYIDMYLTLSFDNQNAIYGK